MTAPRSGEIAAVQQRLRASQGPFTPKPLLPVIDELVATVLSQHTSDVNSDRAFAELKARFPEWEQVADAPVTQVADAIRAGGIVSLLRSIIAYDDAMAAEHKHDSTGKTPVTQTGSPPSKLPDTVQKAAGKAGDQSPR